MAVQFIEGFDHYGVSSAGRTAMLDGPWAEVTGGNVVEPRVPSFGARTGANALYIQNFTGAVTSNLARRILTTARPIVRTSMAVYLPAIPQASNSHIFCRLTSAANAELFRAAFLANGGIGFYRPDTTLIASSSGNAVTANAWNHIEVLVNRTSNIAQCRVNGVLVIDATSLTLGSDDYAQWTVGIGGSTGASNDMWIDDLVVSDATGTYNTGSLGDVRVATLVPSDDTTTTGWAAYARRLFGNNVFSPGDGAIHVADAAALNLGSGAYTVESFVRFRALPTGSNSATIMGQWREDTNQRSWRLLRWGPSVSGGALEFQISTDGTSGGVTTLRTWTGVTFIIGRWYHIAVSRNSGNIRLFIDGQLCGAAAADAATYFDSTAPVYFGGRQGSGASVVAAGTVLDGWMDEIRLTVGVGRYTANFTTPSAPFTRGVGDPDWTSVQFLAGFGGGLVDESAAARAVTAVGTAASVAPGDGPAKYLTVSEAAPIDDNYVAADLVRATGTLTLTANAAATETVTIGSTTYTFVTALTAANQVLIGATSDISLQNLQAAVNAEAGAGTIYGSGTVANASATGAWLGTQQFRATAITAGVAGNSVATTETLANGSWTAATLTGGADIPGAIIFELSNLPPTATAVRGAQFYTRQSKNDSGACNTQVSLRVSTSFALGADRALTTQPTYWQDLFEEDPSTSAALTVTSINTAAIRLNRTT